VGKLSAQRSHCEALAGKSTLNRLELFAAEGITRYQKIRPQTGAIEGLLVDLFLEAHHWWRTGARPPRRSRLQGGNS
jgi:hypothetical protein